MNQLDEIGATEMREFAAIHGIQQSNIDAHYSVLTQPIEVDR